MVGFIENLNEDERKELFRAFQKLACSKTRRYCEQCGNRLREGSDIFVHQKCWKDYEQYLDQTDDIKGIYNTVTGERRHFNENN